MTCVMRLDVSIFDFRNADVARKMTLGRYLFNFAMYLIQLLSTCNFMEFILI